MSKKINSPKLNMFMEFFRSQGVKFVDMNTGEEILPDETDKEN